MPEKLLDLIPFLAMVNGKPTLNTTRIIEVLIPSILAGIMVGYATLKVLETQLTVIQEDVKKIESRLDKMQDDIYAPRWKR